MKTFKNLSSLKKIRFANATRIVLLNAREIPNQTSFKEYTVQYKSEITPLRAKKLTKDDIKNIKLFVNFYGYWFDLKREIIVMNGITYIILKVNNNLYIKNTKTKDIENLKKYFKIARMLNGSKLATKLIEKLG